MKSKIGTGEKKIGREGYSAEGEMANYPIKMSNINSEHFSDMQPGKKAEEREQHTPKGRQARISVPTFDGLQMLSVDDIVKCVAHESYTEIVLICGAKFMVSRNLKEYQDMLSGFNFFRVHNSILINLRHVKKYVRGEGGYVLMSDGQICEVSRRKKQELVNRLSIIEF